jgi:predicted DNA-binding protein (MmcQ/YjbR family)
MPGYHMNKKHWNTVDMHGSLSDKLIKGWIDDSYTLVVNSLPAKTRKQISFDN